MLCLSLSACHDASIIIRSWCDDLSKFVYSRKNATFDSRASTSFGEGELTLLVLLESLQVGFPLGCQIALHLLDIGGILCRCGFSLSLALGCFRCRLLRFSSFLRRHECNRQAREPRGHPGHKQYCSKTTKREPGNRLVRISLEQITSEAGLEQHITLYQQRLRSYKKFGVKSELNLTPI